ncbi:hypothetical protein RGQ15_01460 [Paracoccus sp. MBLB3053]|uniref:Uncharacterized protein n=1 Tax=Paracoccus aurantius TaxID=3073814 RepID=A0ABU2HMH5_9RHOB|nr:hypothetical protein [Paracoccus sp. MBLB3053]MDS9466240.1 hypothetical protein [Paracoccus sp. MBLB3053]
MTIEFRDPAPSRTIEHDRQPHFVPPPPQRPQAPELPRRTTTEQRSPKSVLLHWLLMLGGCAAITLIGRWLS